MEYLQYSGTVCLYETPHKDEPDIKDIKSVLRDSALTKVGNVCKDQRGQRAGEERRSTLLSSVRLGLLEQHQGCALICVTNASGRLLL